MDRGHADLAASVQQRLEEVLLDLARWLHEQTGDRVLTLAGGVALNCVANTRILAESPFEQVWVQPAAGDAGTALGGALHVARELGERHRSRCRAPPSAAAGPTTRSRGLADDGGDRLRAPATTSPTPSPRCWPTTASSPGSRAAASTAPARWATARCWRTPATRRTWSG